MEVVGVAEDVANYADPVARPAFMYLPFYSYPSEYLELRPLVVVRKTGDPMDLAPTLRHTVESLDPSAVIPEILTGREWGASFVADQLALARLSGGVAAASLLLAMSGLVGVIAHATASRRHELGIRMALGARHIDVRRLVVGGGLRLALTGIAVGIGASLLAAPVVSSLVHGLSASDPATLMVVAGFVLAIAVAASYYPARAASRVNLVDTLSSG